ncbi:MAG TPA: amino acid ABC transporter substrate-binding protein [Acetobacteraceae bacterium]|jgi:general L-amino acid transport system substrate-binding protein|nr:amino acid ABC transporter substrate-binding protein [Acetobacteraceae bacterium]
MRALLASLFALLAPAALAQTPPPQDTLQIVRNRGQLVCGVATSGVGLSMPDSQGVWRGIDADYCRALAAAVLGSPDKVRFVPTTTQQRFTALQSGEVDVLIRATTWTFSRDVTTGLSFTGVNLYDGQGFMVHKALGVKSAKELDGATICLLPGTTSEQNATDYFRANKMTFKPVVIESPAEIQQAFFSGRCDVYSNDRTDMTGIRAAQGARGEDLVILPETISKEPLGPAVRKGDPRWFDVVRWMGFALVSAEELGVTQANVEQMRNSPNPEIRRLLGVEGDFGKGLGVANEWVVDMVKATGNYGEIWDRNQKPLGVERGLNRLWRDGGLQYSPPFR